MHYNNVSAPLNGMTEKAYRQSRIDWSLMPLWAHAYFTFINGAGRTVAMWLGHNGDGVAPVFYDVPGDVYSEVVYYPNGLDAGVSSLREERMEAAGEIDPLGVTPRKEEALRPGENPSVEKVIGYRRQTDHELKLINDIKSFGNGMVLRMFDDVEKFIEARKDSQEAAGIPYPDRVGKDSYDHLMLAKERVQEAWMYLIRAVAAPHGFV